MAITKDKKKEIIKKISESAKKQKAAVLVDFKGFKAKDLFELRKKLKKENCLLYVAKKNLLNIALKEEGLDFDKKKWVGEIALIFGFEDEIAPAKIVYQTASKNDNLKILGGIFNNNMIGKEEVLALAKLPSKQELKAKVVYVLNAPLQGMASVLQGNIRGLVYALSSIKK